MAPAYAARARTVECGAEQQEKVTNANLEAAPRRSNGLTHASLAREASQPASMAWLGTAEKVACLAQLLRSGAAGNEPEAAANRAMLLDPAHKKAH